MKICISEIDLNVAMGLIYHSRARFKRWFIFTALLMLGKLAGHMVYFQIEPSTGQPWQMPFTDLVQAVKNFKP